MTVSRAAAAALLVVLSLGASAAGAPATNQSWSPTALVVPALHLAAGNLTASLPQQRRLTTAVDCGTVPSRQTEPLCLEGRLAPGLQVLGCMKCGTSTLHYELTNRAGSQLSTGQVLGGEFWFTKKEKHYFDRDVTFKKGTKWYLSHYPRCAPNGLRSQVAMDATQAYSKIHTVPARMLGMYGELAPKVVFVFMLRDPVARLFSNYFHRKRCCLGELTFHEWVQQQLDEAKACFERDSTQPLWPHCGEEGLFAGMYSLQLALWLQHFCTSQFMLVSFASFVADPAHTIARIANRLNFARIQGVPLDKKFDPAGKPLDVKRKNAKTPGDQTLDAGIERQMQGFYQPFNDHLLALVRANPGFEVVPSMAHLEKDFSYGSE